MYATLQWLETLLNKLLRSVIVKIRILIQYLREKKKHNLGSELLKNHSFGSVFVKQKTKLKFFESTYFKNQNSYPDPEAQKIERSRVNCSTFRVETTSL